MYLFSNSVNNAPQMDLFDELAKAQCEDVHGKLSDNCKQYLLYEWRGKQVDFLQLLAYVRRVYDDDPVQGVATASSSISASALFLSQNSPQHAQQQLHGLLLKQVWKATVLSARPKEAAKTVTKAIALSKERSSTRGT